MFKENVLIALDKIRPALQADGGDVELLSADESTGRVIVRLQGSCTGCPMSTMTLKHGIENALKTEVPGVTSVDAEM